MEKSLKDFAYQVSQKLFANFISNLLVGYLPLFNLQMKNDRSDLDTFQRQDKRNYEFPELLLQVFSFLFLNEPFLT